MNRAAAPGVARSVHPADAWKRGLPRRDDACRIRPWGVRHADFVSGKGPFRATVGRMDVKHLLTRDVLLAVSLVCIAGSAIAASDPPPASDAEEDRMRYEQAEAERAAARSGGDYGRYDRADLKRSRQAACQRLANAPGPRWAVGGYIETGSPWLRSVQDYRGYGVRRPTGGAYWMCADSGDMLLVVPGGRIMDVVTYE